MAAVTDASRIANEATELTSLVRYAGPGYFIVVVPTFNRGPLLERTIKSLIAQSDERWLALLLDDGSTDDTLIRVGRGGAFADERVFYVRYEDNRGGVAMNEIGMHVACARGDYWVRLGSDDWFEPHKLAVDRIALEAGAKVCYGPYRNLHGETRIGDDFRGPPSDVRGALLSGGFACSWANIAAQTEVLEEVHERFGSFCDLRIRNMEDRTVNQRMVRLTDFTWRGLTDDGRVIVGGRCWEDVPAEPSEVRYDAIWRIAPPGQGASTAHDIIAHDARIAKGLFIEETRDFGPIARPELDRPAEVTVHRLGD